MHERGYARCCMNPCPATDAYPSPLCTGAWRTSVARGWQGGGRSAGVRTAMRALSPYSTRPPGKPRGARTGLPERLS